jgi:hypothetical protein
MMMIERRDPSSLSIKEMPDGSRIVLNSSNETVLALNATAAAAWEACDGPTSLAEVTERMQRALGSELTEEIAEQSILKLQEQNLVTTSGAYNQTSRRAVLATLGTIALPLVVSMTVAQQKAYAKMARSGAPDRSPKTHLSYGGDENDQGENEQ